MTMYIHLEPNMNFEEEWPTIQAYIDRVVAKVEGDDSISFTAEEIMSCYTTVYKFCHAKPINYAEQVYHKLTGAIEGHINTVVLPSLRGKNGEVLLSELLRRWSNHKTLTRWLLKVFHCLSVQRWSNEATNILQEICFVYFYRLVYGEMNEQIVDAMLFMIDREREGEEIDRALVYNTYALYSEMKYLTSNGYVRHFGETVVKHNAEVVAKAFSYGDYTLEEENPIVQPDEKIYIESCDGVVFEVDYGIALKSPKMKDLMKKTNPTTVDDEITFKIRLHCVSSKILRMVIDYCKKNRREELRDYIDCFEMRGDDQETVFEILLASNYLNIKGLIDLSVRKITGRRRKVNTGLNDSELLRIVLNFMEKERLFWARVSETTHSTSPDP